MNILLGSFSIVFYLLFIGAYLLIRPKKVLSVIDLFVFWFSVQYGIHASIIHDYLEVAYTVEYVYPSYILGLILTYFGLAFSFIFFGTLFKLRTRRMFPLDGRDINEKEIPVIIFSALSLVLFFIAIQGFDISRTLNYLKFFFVGDSLYSYTELRRELYAEDFSVKVSSLLRQSLSAIVFSLLIYSLIKFKKQRLLLITLAILVFVFCSMQMNKFPLLYSLIVCILILFLNKSYETGVFFNKTVFLKILLGLLIFLSILSFLYYLQYHEEVESGVVTWDRILFRVIYRPFAANHDGLYLWYDFFPDKHAYLNLSNISIFSESLGLNYMLPPAYIPEYYGYGNTTFQTGFIGNGYASFGYMGILIYSVVVGFIVSFLAYCEGKIQIKWKRILFTSIVGMNFYFFSSRELHTALLSGGILLAPLIFLLISFLPRFSFKR